MASRRTWTAIATTAFVLASSHPASALLIGEPNNLANSTINNLSTSMTGVVRINSGGAAVTDTQGRVWQADQFSDGGSTNMSTEPISGTDDDILFQSERLGATGYNIPLVNGEYTLALLFAELDPMSGLRLISVSAENQTLLGNYNIDASVGAFAADVQAFGVTVADGMLNIQLAASASQTTIAGIEVLAARPPECQPKKSVFRMNTGGPEVTDLDGFVWQADQYATGGGGNHVVTTAIAETDNPVLFQSERWGSTGYDIPIDNGNYTLELSFAEINPTSGTRIFDVSVGGSVVFDDLNISAKAGNFTALVLDAPAEVTDGVLHLGLAASANSTSLAAIQIFTGQDSCHPAEVVARINAGGSAITDTNGNVWSADTGSLAGGGNHAVTNTIANANFQQLFQSERWGTPGYDIPVANGNYEVMLGFAELNPASGTRVFNVSINNTLVLENYNIQAAVGPFAADKRVFYTTVTDGVLRIRFTGISNAPTISAIEVATTDVSPPPVVPPPPPPPPDPDDGWKVVVSDKFDGNTIDTSKWSVYSGKGNEGVGMRTPKNVKVHDGQLELQGTEGFYGAGISNKFNFTHGRVVVRAKVDRGAGYGPANLMWPKSEKWPHDGEIDISEIPRGEREKSYFTVHWGATNQQTSATTTSNFTEWHTWTMEWDPKFIKGWVDGVLVKTVTTPAAIPINPMHLGLQQDVGAAGHWIPPRDQNTPPIVSFRVDSVEIFQKPGAQAVSDVSAHDEIGDYDVSGPILDHYNELGGEAVVGLPIDQQYDTPPRAGLNGVWQPFEEGNIFYSAETGAVFVAKGILLDQYMFVDCGFFCGLPTHEIETASTGDQMLRTQLGGIFYSRPSTGEVFRLYGDVAAKYESLGGLEGPLKFPTSDTAIAVDGEGFMARFTWGAIYATDPTGAYEVHGAILWKWNLLDNIRGDLGYPISDEYSVPGGRQSDFQHGSIFWNSSTGELTVTQN